MSFRPQRDDPLPKGLVHGITSIMFESALEPAKPPEPQTSSDTGPAKSRSSDHKEKQDDGQANQS